MDEYDLVLSNINESRIRDNEIPLSHKDLILNVITYAISTNDTEILNPIYNYAKNNIPLLKKNYTDLYLPENKIIIRINNNQFSYKVYNNINDIALDAQNNYFNNNTIEQRVNMNIPFKYFFLISSNFNEIKTKLLKSIKAVECYNLTNNIVLCNSTCKGFNEYAEIVKKYSEYIKGIHSSIIYLPLPYKEKNLSLYIIQTLL